MPNQKNFYTLEELENTDLGKGKKYAVLGYPVGHSLSPAMQNTALEKISQSDVSYSGSRYLAIEVPPESLENALRILSNKKFCGVNLTIPHKTSPLAILKNVDSYAREAGACNTLRALNGTWEAFNTDGFGLQAALKKLFNADIEGRDVFILGAGGAARGVAFWIARNSPKSLNISNRSEQRRDKLIEDLKCNNINCNARSPISMNAPTPENSIIINATSVGLKDSDKPVLDFSSLPNSCIFFDMPYAKGRQTPSVVAARKAGLRADSGLAMLAFQGAKSLEIWTGKPFMGELMLDTLKKITG